MQLSVDAPGRWPKAPAPPARNHSAPPPTPRNAGGGVPPHAVVLGALQPIGTAARVRRGRQIFVEGEPAAHWHWLASGAVQVCSYAEDGKRLVAEFVLPGDLFGLEACARRGGRSGARRRGGLLPAREGRGAGGRRPATRARLPRGRLLATAPRPGVPVPPRADERLGPGRVLPAGDGGALPPRHGRGGGGPGHARRHRRLPRLDLRNGVARADRIAPARQSIQLADRAALASAKDAGR